MVPAPCRGKGAVTVSSAAAQAREPLAARPARRVFPTDGPTCAATLSYWCWWAPAIK